MLTPFQTSLARQSAVIGAKVAFDVVLSLPSGRSVTAHAHFPDFGLAKGTLIFHSFDEYRDVREELLAAGYSSSEFGDPQDSYYEPDSLRETLAEWGWAGDPDKEPPWVKRFEKDSTAEE